MSLIVKKTVLIVSGIMMLSVPVWAATDYSSMSTEELAKIRGTLREASVEERNAFRTEWQSRMQQLTPEERQQYGVGSGAGSRFGRGAGRGVSASDGSGAGAGPGGGGGRGNGRGGGRW